MKPQIVVDLREPQSREPLEVGPVYAEEFGEIKEGELVAAGSGRRYAVKNFIPRFVEDDSYTASFGEQWNRYRRTQIDRFNGTHLSKDRFYSGTGWTPEELAGQRVLEVGCGAGRFTQILLDAGAEAWSLDYSAAVDACWENHGPHPRLQVFKGDLYALPFRQEFFDKVFCYGVLQATPDPERAFMSLIPFLKPGGKIAIDIYHKTGWTDRWRSKYYYRWLTKRIPHNALRRMVEWYVPRWLPIDDFCQRLPVLRRIVPVLVPCWNYRGLLPLTDQQIREWAILDTFDALSPRYDFPQTLSEVRSWFEKAGLKDIDVRPGGNGILGNATR